MTLITKNFPVYYAVSKTSTSTEEQKREQEPEGLALNLYYIILYGSDVYVTER